MTARMAGLFVLALAAAAPAMAGEAAAIRERLAEWTADFNAGRIEPVCDLFSRDLISTVRGQGDLDYATRCGILARSIEDPARDFHYQAEIHEVLVEGDIAVARLTWTLFITPLNVTVVERGMNVFRKEADGAWRIVRYLSYEEES